MAGDTLLIPVWELSADHYGRHPVWSWADDDDESLVRPLDELLLPTDRSSLFIKATVCLGNGRCYPGSISVRCSDWFVYAVTLFIGDDEFELHRLLNDDLENEVSKLATQLRIERHQVFPVTYSTSYINPVDETELAGVMEAV